MGARDFREFVVPYYLRIWAKYAGRRSLHNCGRIDHLIACLRDDLQITHLNGFGFPADRDLLGSELGGRVHMVGGPSPVLLKEGPYDTIVAACEAYIRTVGRRGGYVLMTGGGDLPGTPLAHYKAMIEASARVGCPIEILSTEEEQ
jgi:uroporphyrinogen-III decarboxylase